MSTPELTSELPRRGPGDSPPAGWRQIASVWLRRYSPSQGWATLGFLALMLVVVGESITSARWVETPGLVLLLVLSAMAGMVLAKVRARWYLLQTLGLLVGGLVVLWRTSLVIDAPSTSERVREMFDRLDVWYEAATSGGISTDLMPFTALLLSATWLLGFFGSWFVFRRNNVWFAVVMSGVVLMTNLSFLPDDLALRFFMFMLLAMLLIVRVSVVQRHEIWRNVRIRFTPANGWLTIHASLWFSAIVLLVAALLPTNWVSVPVAAELWGIGRTPVARVEDVFTRLFSTLPTRKDLPGRFFGSTLPFMGKIAFGGEVVASAITEYPSYWLSQTYSEYTSLGWIAPETEQIEVGPEILPPPRTDHTKRESVSQTLTLKFSDDKFLSGGDYNWVSRSGTLDSLLPKKFAIDINDPSQDASLPDDIQELAAELRSTAKRSAADAADQSISVLLPDDLIVLDSQTDSGGGVGSITLQRKAPIAPDVTGWNFDTKFAEDDSYGMESFVSTATDDELRRARSSYDRFITDHYLQLPASLPQRVRDLALQLTEGHTSPLDKALAVQEYLRGPTFTFSREIDAPPRGDDGVEHFLFETKTGYSDYFGSSMAVMLRVAGVPARMAVGYAPGELEQESGRRLIRDSDSHSWVQVYFPSYGWIDFEPTPNWIIQARVPGGVEGIPLPEAGGDLGGGDASSGETPFDFLDEEFLQGLGSSGFTGTLPTGLNRYLIAAGIAIVALAIVVLVSRLFLSFGLGGLSTEEKAYAKMGRLGLIARVRPRSNQTPWEYAAVVGLAVPNAAEAARSIATTYALSRYGRRPPDEDELVELNAAWKRVRLSLLAGAIRRLVPEPSPKPRRQLSGG